MMNVLIRCCAAPLVAAASIVSVSAAPPVAASGTINETLSITFLTPSLGWRVTDRWNGNAGPRRPLSIGKSTDGGVHWHVLSQLAGAGDGTNGTFNVYAGQILFADPRDGWLYGNRLYATHDGGRHWRRLPLRGVQTKLSVSGQSVWRLDSACNATANHCRFTLLTSTAGSDPWQVRAWHPPGAAFGAGLVRADQLHAWLVSGPAMVNGHMVLRLLATADGARSWHPLPMPCSRQGAGSMEALLVPYSAAQLWMVCASEPSAGSQPKAVFRSGDGGHTWRLLADSGDFGNDVHALGNLAVTGYLNGMAVTTESDAWIALGRGTLLHTGDGGRSWHDAIPYAVANPLGGGVGPIQFVDTRHGWLLSFPDLLFRTVDGGRHWRRIPLG